MFEVNDWQSAVNWLLRTYAKNLEINKAVDRFLQINQSEGEDYLAYFNRFEEYHARYSDYLPSAQLILVYIESLVAVSVLYLREERKDKHRITDFELCRKACNQGESLQYKPKTLQHQPKHRAFNLRDVNFIDREKTSHVHIFQK